MVRATSLFCLFVMCVAFSRVLDHPFPLRELVGSAVLVCAQPLFQWMVDMSKWGSVQARTVGVDVAQARVTAGILVDGITVAMAIAIIVWVGPDAATKAWGCHPSSFNGEAEVVNAKLWFACPF